MVNIENENSYGVSKRFQYVCAALRKFKPMRVLDVGCGAGTYLTQPLAGAFPQVDFTGVDSDETTIRFAQGNNRLSNLNFKLDGELAADARFDFIIASEVIEHVEDPARFLSELRGKLSPQGHIVLTMPNGYGPFEIMSFCQIILRKLGLAKLLQRAFGRGGGSGLVNAPETLAVSPHINFFSFGKIQDLISYAGFTQLDYKPRTFLCGWGLDRFIDTARRIEWNATVADRLPRALASDWMFLLKPVGQPRPFQYRRGWFEKLRKRLNEKNALGI